jgi:hypothetical protein
MTWVRRAWRFRYRSPARLIPSGPPARGAGGRLGGTAGSPARQTRCGIRPEPPRRRRFPVNRTWRSDERPYHTPQFMISGAALLAVLTGATARLPGSDRVGCPTWLSASPA